MGLKKMARDFPGSPMVKNPVSNAGVLSHFSHVQLFATPWTIAHVASLSTGFSRQDYWSGLPCPSPGDLPNPGTEPASLLSPVLADVFFTTRAIWETPLQTYVLYM